MDSRDAVLILGGITIGIGIGVTGKTIYDTFLDPKKQIDAIDRELNKELVIEIDAEDLKKQSDGKKSQEDVIDCQAKVIDSLEKNYKYKIPWNRIFKKAIQ